MSEPRLNRDHKIVVYDEKKIELGEGTFATLEVIPELLLTVYHCREHDILAKGAHWLKLEGQLYRVQGPSLNPKS